MEQIQWRRIHRDLTPEEEARLDRALREAEEIDKPDLLAQLPILRAKAAEPTFSGQLRQAIHTSPLPVRFLAEKAGTDSEAIYDFLLGEQSLPSEVIDRLVEVLGYQLVAVP